MAGIFDLQNKLTRMRFGIVKNSEFISGILKYKVHIENYHSAEASLVELSDGVPVFHAGINSKRYHDEARVLIIIEDNEYDTVYILGEIDDRHKLNTEDPGLPKGQSSLSTKEGNSGILGVGDSTELILWGNKTDFRVSSLGLESNVGNKNLFSVSNTYSKISNLDSHLTLSRDFGMLKTEGALTLFSTTSSISLGAQNIFLESNGIINLSATNSTKISSQTVLIEGGLIKIKGLIATAFSSGTTSIDMSVLQGNIGIATADGDIKINALSPSGTLPPLTGIPNKILISLGPSKLPLSFLQLKSSESILETTPMQIKLSQTGIVIGSKISFSSEPMVKGEALNTILSDLVSAIKAITVPTALGPSGTPLMIPPFATNILKVEAKLNALGPHLSKFVKVT